MYWLSHMNQEELREKYVKLKDDFFTIKKFSCRQEDKIKKLVYLLYGSLGWHQYLPWGEREREIERECVCVCLFVCELKLIKQLKW